MCVSFTLGVAECHAALLASSTVATFGVYVNAVKVDGSYVFNAYNRPLIHRDTCTA